MSTREQDDSKLAADAERELTRLWRAWRTVHEMCQDRVCNTPQSPVLTLTTFVLTSHPRATN